MVEHNSPGQPFIMGEPSDTRHMFHQKRFRVGELDPKVKKDLKHGSRFLLYASILTLMCGLLLLLVPFGAMFTFPMLFLAGLGAFGSIRFAQARNPIIVLVIIVLVLISNLFSLWLPLVTIPASLGFMTGAISLSTLMLEWKHMK
jgi:hypothetical protein